MRLTFLRHEFVDLIPDDLAEGTLYVSIPFATVVHKCCCGCGSEVVTPLGPTDWQLVFDGESVSLTPSIGNWSLPCQSHYWIHRDRVEWAPRWSPKAIAAGRAADRVAKERYFAAKSGNHAANQPQVMRRGVGRLLQRLWRGLRK